MSLKLFSTVLIVVGVLGQVLAVLNWWLTAAQKKGIADLYVDFWCWLEGREFGRYLRAVIGTRLQTVIAILTALLLLPVFAFYSLFAFQNAVLFGGIGRRAGSLSPGEDAVLAFFLLGGISLVLAVAVLIVHPMLVRFLRRSSSPRALVARFVALISAFAAGAGILMLGDVASILWLVLDDFVALSVHRSLVYFFIIEGAILSASLLPVGLWIACVLVAQGLTVATKVVIEKTLATGSGPLAGLSGFLATIGLAAYLVVTVADSSADEGTTVAESEAAPSEIPKEAGDEGPVSGSESDVIAVTDQTFGQEVLASPLPVLVSFSADWSGPSRVMRPHLDDLARDMRDSLRVATLDVDENPLTPPRYGVRAVPALILFIEGERVAQRVGVVSRGELYAWARAQTGSDEPKSPCGPFERNRHKPHANIGTLGQTGGGKSVLTSAITRVLSTSCQARFVPVERVLDPPEEVTRGIATRTFFVEYETDARHYAHADSPRASDYTKNLITGALRMDGAILVVGAADGVTAQTRDHIELARLVGISKIVLFVNLDGSGQERAREVERRTLGVLAENGFPAEKVPVVRGSAQAALEDRDQATGRGAVLELLEALDREIPVPAPLNQRPFLMPIEDVFSIAGRGTVATGRVERGAVKPGDQIEIVGLEDTRRTVVTGVEMFRKLLDRAEAGDNVGVVLREVGREDLERGQVLAAPGSISAHRRFRAAAYLLTEEEGGRSKPILPDARPQFYFRTTDVTGTVMLEAGSEIAMPGERISMEVELNAPIAMAKGLRFAIREGGRTIGVGIVTAVVDES